MTLRSATNYFLARLAPALLGLVSIAVLTRCLSAHDFGRYALIVAVAGFLNVFFLSWNSNAFFRHYGEAIGPRRAILLSTTAAGFAASLALASLAAVFAGWLGGTGFDAATVGAGITFLAALSAVELLGARLNLEGRSVAYALLQIGRALGTILAGGGIAYFTGSVSFAILAIALSWGMLAISMGFFRWIAAIRARDIEWNLTKQFLRYGAPLTAAIALMQAVNTLDRLMLALLRDEAAVAEYSAAFDLVQFTIGSIGSALSLVFYPALMAAWNRESPHLAETLLRKYAAAQIAILLPASVGLGIIGPSLAQMLIGPQLSEGAASVMPWVAAAMFIGVLKAYYFDLSFQLDKWTSGNLIIAAITLIATVLFNFALIPTWGAAGAAQASLGGFALAMLASVALGNSCAVPMPIPWRETAKVVVATAFMAASVLAIDSLDTPLILTAAILGGGAAYASAMLVMDGCGSRQLFATLFQHWQDTHIHD